MTPEEKQAIAKFMRLIIENEFPFSELVLSSRLEAETVNPELVGDWQYQFEGGEKLKVAYELFKCLKVFEAEPTI